MKKIEHQIFLKNNKLDKKLLLQPIQEKIIIFDRMHQMLDTISECEKGDLLEQLETLDFEILEDIDEEYADKLEYNEIIEELESPPIQEKEKIHLPKSKDESILSELVKMGRVKDIGRSTFKDLGIKTHLGWQTIIGKYIVTRTSVFRYRYSIEQL
ncbi:hypothetical protein [Aquimarina agarivorans]|uniref:hypothetical protein n=1 Tax=Aquimarina agarivorans TaxID=980584 RepID=UPI000248FC47|nr:hypothetical protein [Aquimarina agarivorans]